MPEPAVDIGMRLGMQIADLRVDLDQARAAMKQTRDEFRGHADGIGESLHGLRGPLREVSELSRGLGAAMGGVRSEALQAGREILLGLAGGPVIAGIALLGLAVGKAVGALEEVNKKEEEAKKTALESFNALTEYEHSKAEAYAATNEKLEDQIIEMERGKTAARDHAIERIKNELAVQEAMGATAQIQAQAAATDAALARGKADQLKPDGILGNVKEIGLQATRALDRFFSPKDLTETFSNLHAGAEQADQFSKKADQTARGYKDAVEQTRKLLENTSRLNADQGKKEGKESAEAHQKGIEQALDAEIRVKDQERDKFAAMERDDDHRESERFKIQLTQTGDALEERLRLWREHSRKVQESLQQVTGFAEGLGQGITEFLVAPLQKGFQGLATFAEMAKNLIVGLIEKLLVAIAAAAVLAILTGGSFSAAFSITSGIGSLTKAIEGTGGHASGGLIGGAGSGTSDSILARLSSGEYVMPAAAVSRWGVGFMEAVAGRGYASGGLVQGGGAVGGNTYVTQNVMAFDAPATDRGVKRVETSEVNRFNNRQGQLWQKRIRDSVGG